MRLIDANKLNMCEGRCPAKSGAAANCCAMCIYLCNAPTVKAPPMIHAKWEKVSEWMPIYRCSECKERNFFKDGNNVLTNFCPHCGAKMDA